MKSEKDKREVTVRMGRDGFPVAEIAEAVKATRAKVMTWLKEADIEPVMLRSRKEAKTGHGKSLRNTPLALSIDERVRKRVAERERREAREAAREAAK